MAALVAAKPAGLVVDLRRCRGGYVEDVAEARALALARAQCKVHGLSSCWLVTGCSCAASQPVLPEAARAAPQGRCRRK
eukprot:10596648-Alexandrium_andersonii.AAC.1